MTSQSVAAPMLVMASAWRPGVPGAGRSCHPVCSQGRSAGATAGTMKAPPKSMLMLVPGVAVVAGEAPTGVRPAIAVSSVEMLRMLRPAEHGRWHGVRVSTRIISMSVRTAHRRRRSPRRTELEGVAVACPIGPGLETATAEPCGAATRAMTRTPEISMRGRRPEEYVQSPEMCKRCILPSSSSTGNPRLANMSCLIQMSSRVKPARWLLASVFVCVCLICGDLSLACGAARKVRTAPPSNLQVLPIDVHKSPQHGEDHLTDPSVDHTSVFQMILSGYVCLADGGICHELKHRCTRSPRPLAKARPRLQRSIRTTN